MIVTKSGISFISLELKDRPVFTFSRNRVEFYALYRKKKLKRLKHIDVHGEKAGIMGRIWKGRKKVDSLINMLKGRLLLLIFIGTEEEMKVLEHPDSAPVRRDTAGKEDMKEYYREQEAQSKNKWYTTEVIRTEPQTKSAGFAAHDKISDVKLQAELNLQALNERGEKIEELHDKS